MPEKIQVTPQQRANAIEAREVMWPSVPPENVIENLRGWRQGRATTKKPDCGTVACFGGWCAWWPSFRKQGVRPSGATAAPELLNGSGAAREVSTRLFGRSDMFYARGCHSSDLGFVGSDHQLITHRLSWLIENSEVAT